MGVFVFCAVVFFAAGYAIKPILVTPKEKIKIVGDAGRYVEVPRPLENLVVLHSDAGEIIVLLGAENKVVGVDSRSKEKLSPKFDDLTEVGTAYKPSYETITALCPQVVISYSGRIGSEVAERLEPHGIKVVCLDPYKIEFIARDVKLLGFMLGEEERANEYVEFFEGYLKIIENRVKGLRPENKVRVYLEGYTDLVTVAADTGGHKMTIMAGGINVFAGEPVSYPSVNYESVVDKNPQVIIKAMGGAYLPVSGRTLTDPTPFVTVREMIINRPGWSEIDAVKENRVYLIAWDICGGPSQVVSVYYMAKWFYPYLFEDLDPESIHKAIVENFMDVEYKGVFVYP